MEGINPGDAILNGIKCRAVRIDLGIRAQNNGLMAAQIQVIQHIRADCFIETCEWSIYDQWRNQLRESAQCFVKRQHPNLPLSGGGVCFLP